jgi:isoleucyl-tRNA synthetase
MTSSQPVFAKVPSQLDFPKEEAEVLAFWREHRIFEKSLEGRDGAKSFVFYEGPPTANGLPHNGHVLTRVIKDLFPRYRAMRGQLVPRKAGWDTHGLPVEVEVEKELRIHGKAAIEQYGVEPFVRRCIESVFRYTDDWERLTERVGFWVDLKSAYVTYHRAYVESVWWALSELFRKGLLYQGHKVVWWWAQGGTALSSAEVGQGYKTVDDPSAYVAFPLEKEPDTALLVWTTTPWTLPSNAYAAVHQDFDYVVVTVEEKADKAGPRPYSKLVVAKGLLPTLEKALKATLSVVRELKGAELVGLRYRPPFDFYEKRVGAEAVATKDGASLPMYFRVLSADFVTLDAGTGIVHLAPAFGEDDHQTHRRELAKYASPEAVPLLCAVEPDGTFVKDLPKYGGRWVKDCDKEIQAELKERGLLVHSEIYRHDYPFCWRADSDPLIQYARPAWYIRTTARIDKAIENNKTIQWLPSHIGDGRFGDFLANNVDWALSRERYWGTPLNIWVNDVTGNMEAPSSVDAILAKNPRAFDHFHEAKKKDPTLSDHLIVHKPWIDQVTWQNPGEEGTYRRVPEVIDVWFDSGCMPFAQFGFPHRGVDEFKRSFPADFISEAIDQTRGWFYSLLMISTLVFDDETQERYGLDVRHPHPFKTCIVLGHVSDREGRKESKSKGNYTPPEVILDRVGMEFAVLGPEDVPGVDAAPGTVFIAREELEGLDLQEGAMVRLSRGLPKDGGDPKDLTVRVAKKLRRRVLVLHEDDRVALGVARTAKKDVKPVEVPALPVDERVFLEDPKSPAPGADAFRWFFYASNPPWNATRHSLSGVRALQKEFLVKLRNVYSFFTIYANIDGFDPYAPRDPKLEAAELDRWIRSELALTASGVGKDLDAYDLYGATQKLSGFVDALSNWYVRRSRDRFWRSGWDRDKAAAYDTLYTALVTFAKLIAPFVPFSAEAMYQNLVVGPAKRAGAPHAESVHLAEFPRPVQDDVDAALSAKMAAVRDVVSLGLQVRTQHKLKVRQPLRSARVVLSNGALTDAILASSAMIRDELNVLDLELVPTTAARAYVEYKLKPNFRTLGQRGLGKQAQELKKVMGDLPAEAAASLVSSLVADGRASLGGVELLREDVEVAFETKPGFAAAGDRVGVVVLETTLDDELKDLGFARELQNRIQTERKERGLEYTDRIQVRVLGSARAISVVDARRAELAAEVLATSIECAALVDADVNVLLSHGYRELDVEGDRVLVRIERVG